MNPVGAFRALPCRCFCYHPILLLDNCIISYDESCAMPKAIIHRPHLNIESLLSLRSNICDVVNNSSHSSDLIRYIYDNIIGREKVFSGPFGNRKTIYCDWTASGKSLYFIEQFINAEVLPTYGNTHTTSNVTSLQTTMFRHEAKDIIRSAVHASADDAVIFVGSGCTGAVHKLIHNLHLEQPPIVIVGPFEHHSNILPWRHLAAKVLRAETDSSGTVSLHSLESLLRIESINAQELGCKLIVCMAAASNVTGILVDVNAFSSLTHRYGGLAFWDYATAAPYVEIDMNPVVLGPDRAYVHKDAVYFSMHKFIGGPQTPGVLIAKRALFKAGESHPSSCGGGTVFFVRRDDQIYLKDVEEREEGGTPAIVESIRAGLVMQLKHAVTCAAIMEREESLVRRIWDRLADCPNIIILGGKEAPRLPIISVVVRHPLPTFPPDKSTVFTGQRGCLFLHHNFVCDLLNDLFGIQARGGCACAGPYAMDLLGIDEALAKLYEDALVDCRLGSYKPDQSLNSPQREFIRPGFARISLPFFIPDEEADFILDALKFIATYGWIFLPLYRYNCSTGEWIHHKHEPNANRKWLKNVHYTDGRMTWSSDSLVGEAPAPSDFQACLRSAHVELCRTLRSINSSTSFPVSDDNAVCSDELVQELRWFLLPAEAAAQIRNEPTISKLLPPNVAPWHPGSLSPCFCPDLEKFLTKELTTVSRRLSIDSPVHEAVLQFASVSYEQHIYRPSSTTPGSVEHMKMESAVPDMLTTLTYRPRVCSQSENLSSNFDRGVSVSRLVNSMSRSTPPHQLSAPIEVWHWTEDLRNAQLVVATSEDPLPVDPDTAPVGPTTDNNNASSPRSCSSWLLSIAAEVDSLVRVFTLPLGSALQAKSVLPDDCEPKIHQPLAPSRTPKRNL